MTHENEWEPGMPPGEMNEENEQWFLDTYEVYFSPAGAIWHRIKENNHGAD